MGSVAKIIVDEDEGKTQLMCTKALEKDENVFLIDHAWTYIHQQALSTLMENPVLVERIEKMTEDVYKLELPQPAGGEEKKEEENSAKIQSIYDEAMAKGGKVFEYDNLGISKLSAIPKFPDTTEQISLFGNEILNPNEIVE